MNLDAYSYIVEMYIIRAIGATVFDKYSHVRQRDISTRIIGHKYLCHITIPRCNHYVRYCPESQPCLIESSLAPMSSATKRHQPCYMSKGLARLNCWLIGRTKVSTRTTKYGGSSHSASMKIMSLRKDWSILLQILPLGSLLI